MSTLTLTVDSAGFGGLFIARHEGKVVMIKGPVLPGEIVEVSIDSERKDYITASLLRVLAPSSRRTAPPCPYYGTCGGCQLQHAHHDQQITLKQTVLGDCLRRIAGLDMALSEPVTDNRQWNYRIRGQFKVSEGAIGLHKRGTRDVVTVGQCLLMDREINDYIPRANRAIGKFRIREIHLTVGDALIGLIITRKGVFSSS
ncbi:MAG: TRAM domain-containing protein, partial [Nitrospiraceae bacterium]